MREEVQFSLLAGKTLAAVDQTRDELTFTADNGEIYKLFHDQDCCEDVYLDDVCGDLQDIVGAPILTAEQVDGETVGFSDPYAAEVKGDEILPESYTWTFYKLSTIKGSVTLRWLGTSNGYYSEGVDFALAS